MHSSLLLSSIAAAIATTSPVLITATGELLVEKVGVYNIGLEGVMLTGALAGFVGDQTTHSWIIGLAVGGACGALVAALFGLTTVVLRGDMIITGIAIVLLATGLTTQLGNQYVRQAAAARIPVWHIPVLSHVPWVGSVLFEQAPTTYLAFALPWISAYIVERTAHGLKMRAIGENPGAADAAGIAVTGWRLTYVTLGGVLAGVGGGVLSLGIIGSWESDLTAGQGWIAFAIVFFAGWNARWVLIGAYMFGALTTLGSLGQAEGWSVPSQVFVALPYIATVAMMIVRGVLAHRAGGRSAWPAALGVPFFRA
jgi:simple sugar transport system permease protein